MKILMIVGVMMEAEDEEEIDQKAPVVAGVGIRAAVADGEMTLMTKMTMTRIGGEEGGRAAEGTAAESGIPLGGITAGADTDADAVEVIPANDIGGEGTGAAVRVEMMAVNGAAATAVRAPQKKRATSPLLVLRCHST